MANKLRNAALNPILPPIPYPLDGNWAPIAEDEVPTEEEVFPHPDSTVVQLEEENARLVSEVNVLRRDLERLQERNVTLGSENLGLRQALDELKGQVSRVQSRLDITLAPTSALRSAVDALLRKQDPPCSFCFP